MVHALVTNARGAIWSPRADDVGAAAIDEAHALGLKVVVWTVNTKAEMERMMTLDVDGIISDYPHLLRRVAGAAGYALPLPTPIAV
jgi:glycerophosphoryl diester phosphodiesterase